MFHYIVAIRRCRCLCLCPGSLKGVSRVTTVPCNCYKWTLPNKDRLHIYYYRYEYTTCKYGFWIRVRVALVRAACLPAPHSQYTYNILNKKPPFERDWRCAFGYCFIRTMKKEPNEMFSLLLVSPSGRAVHSIRDRLLRIRLNFNYGKNSVVQIHSSLWAHCTCGMCLDSGIRSGAFHHPDNCKRQSIFELKRSHFERIQIIVGH